jgi:hypothetical protein
VNQAGDASDLHRFYWIGGSPCAGKSSVAAALAARHGLRHVECDKGSDQRVARMVGNGLPAFDELTALSTCERLARAPEWQAERELEFYREQFDFLLAELVALPADRPIIVEGADLLPDLLRGVGVDLGQAVWLVPTAEFQIRHYAARAWVTGYLRDCDDPEAAFRNWMRRDVLFAESVKELAATVGGRAIVVDGTVSVQDVTHAVAEHLSLSGTQSAAPPAASSAGDQPVS